MSIDLNNKNCGLVFCMSLVYFSIIFFSVCVLKKNWSMTDWKLEEQD